LQKAHSADALSLATGHMELREAIAEGVCVVYHDGAYYCLHRSDTEQAAYSRFVLTDHGGGEDGDGAGNADGLDEGESSEQAGSKQPSSRTALSSPRDADETTNGPLWHLTYDDDDVVAAEKAAVPKLPMTEASTRIAAAPQVLWNSDEAAAKAVVPKLAMTEVSTSVAAVPQVSALDVSGKAAGPDSPRQDAASPARSPRISKRLPFAKNWNDLLETREDDLDRAVSRVSIRSTGGDMEMPSDGHWIDSFEADVLFGVLIALNSVVLGVDVEVTIHRKGAMSFTDPFELTLFLVQSAFVVAFVIECVLHLRAVGAHTFIKTPTYLFDLAVITVTILDLWILSPLLKGGSSASTAKGMRILQLFRLLRVLKLISASRELTLLIKGLVLSLRAVCWVFLLLFVLMYIGSLFCAALLVNGQPENSQLKTYFGSVGSSLYSHFKIITLEAWPDINEEAMKVSTWWVVYFVGFIVVTNLALVNLITGMIMEGVLESGKEDHLGHHMAIHEAGPFQNVLEELLSLEPLARQHWVTKDEFRGFVAKPLTQDVFRIFEISLHLDPDQLFEVLDLEGHDALDSRQLSGALLRLRNSRENPHSFCVQHDLRFGTQELLQRVSSCSQQLEDVTLKGVRELEQQFGDHLDRVSRVATEALDAVKPANSPRSLPLRREVVGLVQQASAKARLLDGLVQKAEAELQESLAREAGLRARLAAQERTKSTQTDGEWNSEAEPGVQGFSSSPRPGGTERNFRPQPLPEPVAHRNASADGDILCT